MVKHVNNNHATRAYSGEALKERLPDLSEPFPSGVVSDEIALAYGRRHVCKLIDVVSLPSSDLPENELHRALRYLLSILTNQESKAEAVSLNTAAPVAALLKRDDPETRRLACETLAALAHSLDGRKSANDADAPSACTALLKDDDGAVRVAAAGFLAAMAKHSDGAAYVMSAAEGGVVAALAAAANDDESSHVAKTLACETLALCTLTDDGVLVALRGGTAVHLMRALEREEARTHTAFRAAVARCLKNVCQHETGKIQAFEKDVVVSLAPLLRSRDADVRLQATGALMGVTTENDAKLAVMKAARNDLAALLRDPTAAVAENALAILQNCCESPAAKKLALEVLSARDQALVLNPQVVGVSY